MNIRKFKEIVSTWDEHKEDFRLFRFLSENCYELFKKDIDLDVADDILMALNDTPEYISQLRQNLERLDLQIVINVHSMMGWTLDDSIRSKKVILDYHHFTTFRQKCRMRHFGV